MNRSCICGHGKVVSPAAGFTLLEMAVVRAAAIVPPAWVCGNAAVPAKMPAMGENRTSVPNPYLPLECAGRKQ